LISVSAEYKGVTRTLVYTLGGQIPVPTKVDDFDPQTYVQFGQKWGIRGSNGRSGSDKNHRPGGRFGAQNLGKHSLLSETAWICLKNTENWAERNFWFFSALWGATITFLGELRHLQRSSSDKKWAIRPEPVGQKLAILAGWGSGLPRYKLGSCVTGIWLRVVITKIGATDLGGVGHLSATVAINNTSATSLSDSRHSTLNARCARPRLPPKPKLPLTLDTTMLMPVSLLPPYPPEKAETSANRV
jgi:hypothetical protein